MAERFNSLYSLADNLYLEDFPFVVSAGKLLFDTQTGKALAQLKIKNISTKQVSALKIRINCFDVAKHELGDAEFTYLDLTAAPNTEFGQKTPVYLPYSETRSFEVNFVEAVYSDGEVLAAPAGSLCAIPAPQSILVFGKELAEEYEIIHGEKCKFIPQKYNSLWVCACGAINSNQSSECHNCKNSYESLAADVNKELLESKRKARLAAEEEARKEGIYQKACKKEHLEESIKLLESISGYKDASELAVQYKKELEVKQKLDLEQKKRNKKIAMIIIPIVSVLIAFWVLWTNVIQPSMKYNAALDLMKAEKYEDAIAAFEAMDGYKDSVEKITECKTGILDNKYDDALALTEAGNLDEAYGIFTELGNYKDATDKASDILLTKFKEQLKGIKVGSYIKFGAYEQDNNSSNGKEDVEWLVLEVKDGKALVISKYALDCKPYNTSYTDITWETCTLRKWLNNDFLGSAFSANEKAMIPTVTVFADKNPDYSTNPGNATQDQVFLLSITEVNKYFSSNSARQCKPTDYAVANGTLESDSGNCWWWLRSPGINLYRAATVGSNGVVNEYGDNVDYGVVYDVRPALWIDLSE